jgi:galactonate dehydratase
MTTPTTELERLGGRTSITIDSVETCAVQVSPRGNWIIVRLRAGSALTGIGEASHGFGFSKASREDDARMRSLIERYFEFIAGKSPFRAEAFRMAAWARAKTAGLASVTAFSALELALWDLAGKTLGVPVYDLLGGKVRDQIEAYANINRTTNDRSPEEFARNAERAVREGFRAIKAATFDDFPALDSAPEKLEEKAELGIRRLEAIRKTVGPEIRLMLDCHSRFSRDWAVRIARELEPLDLYWFEEPVDPEDIETTGDIKGSISQRMAGGEILSGCEGFEPLCRGGALDVIMPDVKHCGGLLEAKKIAALAEVHDVVVSPHNPSGPVSMAVSTHLCAGIANFLTLEHAWGEVNWRSSLLEPPEQFVNGALPVPRKPGWGVELNEAVLSAHR